MKKRKTLSFKDFNILNIVYKKTVVRRYVELILGLLLISVSFNLFLLPNNIAAGGVWGISIITKHYFNIEPSTFIYISSALLLIISYFFLGREKTFRSLFGSLILPIFIRLTENIGDYLIIDKGDVLLITLFGGFLLGLGSGLVFKAGFTSGGTDILNQIVSKYLQISIGTAMIIIDGTIVLSGLFFFGINQVMYAIIVLYLISILTDKVLLGISDSKAFYIVTSKEEEVKNYIIKYLNHSVTIFNAKGGYSKAKEDVLLCVIPTKEYFKLKEGIHTIDNQAFFIVTDAYEVYGGE